MPCPFLKENVFGFARCGFAALFDGENGETLEKKKSQHCSDIIAHTT
jgi:hypothetical protein